MAGYAIIGFHLKNAEALKLNKVTLHLQYLYDWMGRTGFVKDQGTSRRFSITYERPKVLAFKINTNLRLEAHTWPRTRQGGRMYEVEESTDWRLSFRKPAGLREILSLVSNIRGLLHFSVLRPVHLIKLEGNKNRHGTKYPEFFLPEDVEVISDLNRPDVERYTHSQEFIFTFSDVANSFGDFLSKWIDYEEKFKNALGRYYTTVYHSQTSEEQHLSLTRALDAYYGIKYNQPTLNDFPRKIRELATLHHSHIKTWEPDIEVFVDKVRATRHFHTHYNPKWQASGNVLSGAKLVILNTVLRMLFQICVLEDVGIPSARFNRLYRQMPVRVTEYSA